MEFNLKKDIVFFDIESTGLNVVRDRIVQIALIKYFANGDAPVERSLLINPGISISKEAEEVHGITMEMVLDKPEFSEVAEVLYNFIGDADLGGYNSDRFDIPMLMEEFHRAGYDFNLENRKHVDVQRIFYKMEPRTLSAAYKYYCGKRLENAHDALADVRATVDVLKGQINKYENEDYVDEDGNITEKPIQNDIEKIYDFSTNKEVLDVTQRLKRNEKGQIVFNFGKYVGKEVAPLLAKDRNYYNWIMEKEFSVQVKNIIKFLMKDYLEKQNK